jgi:hypothetical protein
LGGAEKVESALRELLDSAEGKSNAAVSNALFAIHESAFNHLDTHKRTPTAS